MRHYSSDSWFCNKAHRKIAGVCSGIATRQNWNITAVRIIAILLLLSFPTVVLFAYLLAALILPARYIV